MAHNHSNLIYALKDSKMVSIDDVESGLKCQCRCPACGGKLVAKKGNILMHHFAHYSLTTCEYGYETSLNMAAKDILSKEKKFFIPPVYAKFPNCYKKSELISGAKMIKIEYVELEKLSDDVIPDVVIYTGGKKLFIKIHTMHTITIEKRQEIHDSNISMIEIDLSKQGRIISVEELSKILLNDSAEKTWVYNALEKEIIQKFISAADKYRATLRGCALHIDFCPINRRVWRGKPYANLMNDCIYCEYCISVINNKEILCTGRHLIANLNDFNVPKVDRIKNYNEKIQKYRKRAFESGHCPNCGNVLVILNTNERVSWKCSNFPRCRYMAYTDKDTGEIIAKP